MLFLYWQSCWFRTLLVTLFKGRRNFVQWTEDSLSNFVKKFVVSVICMLFNSNLVQTGWSPMKFQSGFWPAGELLPIMRRCDGATDTRRRAWDAGSMLQMWRYTLSKPQNGNHLEKMHYKVLTPDTHLILLLWEFMGWLCDESMLSINEDYVQLGYHPEQLKSAQLNFENLKITLKSND